MTLLASISRPGRVALSLVSVGRVFSAGKLSSCREGTQISGVRTGLQAEVVFHSPEVLGSGGNPVWAIAGVRQLRWPGSPGLEWSGRGFFIKLFYSETAIRFSLIIKTVVGTLTIISVMS